MGDFTMPSLGADMESGTVSKWLVGPGDAVRRGDVMAVVATEKSTIEVEVFEDGRVAELLVPEGQRVPVGTPLARLVTAAAAPAAVATVAAPAARAAPAAVAARAEPVVRPAPRHRPAAAPTRPSAAPSRPSAAPSRPSATPSRPAAAPVPPPAAPSRHRPRMAPAAPPTLSPVVRRLAAARGVELSALAGTGPGGTITREDVERAGGGTDGARGRRRGVRSSPLARRRAAELGIDLSAVAGTGPGGAVTDEDVRHSVAAATGPPGTVPEAAGPAPVATPSAAGVAVGAAPGQAASTADRAASRRQATGALMARSKREIPHYYLTATCDLGAAADWLEQVNLARPVESRLVVAALLLKATALAARRVPEMNGFFVDGTFRPAPAVHLGVAVSLRTGGLLTPAIHHADELSVDELMHELSAVVARARNGRLRSSDVGDATLTVTNLGDLGVDAVFGVIYPPQVALVGFGRVSERAVAAGGMVGARPCVTVTLSADHRASEGHRGARFLSEIDRLLQEPEQL